ncbi:MAG: biopolymer transporter ExbD [Desertifilum sp. SIO1I2]|nr:biopolymer transporter ExbD [Desertifilum sp. SIO1I2]
MRFKSRQQNSQVPEVNLVPMMDVLMSVLTFFIILSMSLTGQRILNVNLPGIGQGESQIEAVQPLEVGLNNQGEILLSNQVISKTQLTREIQSYLAQNPEGVVTLKADRTLPYRQVSQLLVEMRDVGGASVSLAIERN